MAGGLYRISRQEINCHIIIFWDYGPDDALASLNAESGEIRDAPKKIEHYAILEVSLIAIVPSRADRSACVRPVGGGECSARRKQPALQQIDDNRP